MGPALWSSVRRGWGEPGSHKTEGVPNVRAHPGCQSEGGSSGGVSDPAGQGLG